MTNLVKIKNCEVCGSEELIPVLNLGNHPLCDDLVPLDEDRQCLEYPIEIVHCNNCVTSHQLFQVPKRVLFPASYHYRSRFTADVLNGMKSLVESCEKSLGSLNGLTVLDVGSNDGSLLSFFKEKGCKTIGVEPTGACLDTPIKIDKTYNTYFDSELATQIRKEYGAVDIITFTNVFAHIENLRELVAALKIVAGDKTTIVIENHYLGAVLDRNQFDTFYHEHPRTYSLNSFLHIAESLGMYVDSAEFPSRYGGNIRIFMKKKGANITKAELQNILQREKSEFVELYKEMNEFIKKWQVEKSQEIARLTAGGKKLYAKAFPGRAAILIKMLNLDEKIIEKVFEKPGSIKIGNYIPGTRVPIASDDEFFAMKNPPEHILNLAWHINDEIKSYFKAHGFKGEVVNIL